MGKSCWKEKNKNSSSKKLFILDASGFVFRAYFALPEMKNPLGESSQVVFGFIRSINKLIKEFSPEYMVAVFDGPNNKQSRREIYADYKSNREKKIEDLSSQIALVKEFCHLKGLVHLEIDSVEADDVIASLSRQALEDDYEVCICTADKDLLQLAEPKVVLWNPWKDQGIIEEEDVVQRYGVPPKTIPDYLALVGDSSDNIPGVSGCGPKKAVALLQQFGSVEGLLDNLDQVKGANFTMLAEQRDILKLSKRLAVLDKQISLNFSISSLSFPQSSTNEDVLKTFYMQQGFKTLVQYQDQEVNIPVVEVLVISDPKSLEAVLKNLEGKKVAFAAAYSGKHLLSLVLQGLALSEGESTVYIDLQKHSQELLPLLQRFFLREDILYYGYNIKRDLHALMNAGVVIRNISCDLALVEHLINGGAKTSYQSLLINHGFTIAASRFMKEWGYQALPLVKLPESPAQYFGELVTYLSKLRGSLLDELQRKNLSDILFNLEAPLEQILFAMERAGMPLDIKELVSLECSLEEELITLTNEIYTLAGESFNIKSPKQLSDVLYNKLGLTPIDKARSTKAEVLGALSTEHEIVDKILSFRALEKLLSTYVKALPRQVDPCTNRIHATFDQTGTTTGRLACRDPNLQNIPKRSEQGLSLRKAFRFEREGYSFLSADYSQIELRFLAHLSQDNFLKQAFDLGEDVHAVTASQVFQVSLNQVTKQQRLQAKTVNFGIIYGQQAYGLSKILKISLREAQALIKAYFDRYPGVAHFVDETIKQASRDLRVTTMLGRERIIDNWDEYPGVRAASGRLAVNTRIQGSAAELIKCAMLQISKAIQQRNLKSRILLQIHDELIFEVPDQELQEVSILVRREMESAMTLTVPLVVNILIGKNWAEC
ncbi:DNA polymerase I [Chlamydia sp. 17-3921]|uniref:DNA polymerase I n=1 Tax=Chlamydia sp. 17-3921 TaxID=2675798 RepID=UPI00191A3BD1|nr:DNA polymerase I [Chlamydia sp. 17-3921]